jgi:hypothetical protein
MKAREEEESWWAEQKREEAEQRRVLEEERRRILAEHVQRLVGYIPKGVLQQVSNQLFLGVCPFRRALKNLFHIVSVAITM